MKATQSDLTVERLRELLHYDPETGVFTWKVRTSSRTGIGQVAGSVSSTTGYRRTTIDRVCFDMHRLAWLYTYGTWPSGQVDHINRIRADNRLVNLREVSVAENRQNANRMRNNASGHKGVCWDGFTNRWMAYIAVNHRTRTLGRYADIKDAVAARKAAEAKYHPFAPSGAQTHA